MLVFRKLFNCKRDELIEESLQKLDKSQVLWLPDAEMKTLPTDIKRKLGKSDSTVEKAILYGNNFSSIQFLSISSLHKITTLNLEYNLISSIDPIIAQLVDLQILNLNHNNITEIPQVLLQLTSLKSLLLCNNEIRYIPAEICQLSNLQCLAVANNFLDCIPESISKLSKLIELNVQGNDIDLKLVPSCITNMPITIAWHIQRVSQEILPGLYLGSMDAAHNKTELESRQITHIMTLNKDPHPPFKDFITYKYVFVEDLSSVNLLYMFHELYDYIDDVIANNGKILVHCAAGMSRSASVVIMYVMVKNNCGFEEALEFVKKSRPCVIPNEGFSQQLKLWGDIQFQFEGEAYDTYIKNVIEKAKEERFVDVTLTFLKLTYIPSSLLSVSSLVNLYLNDNLIHEIPDDIVKLVNLEYLNLESNKIRKIPRFLGKMQNLKRIFLGNNQIKKVPIELYQLENLLELSLKNNQIKKITEEVAKLRSVNILDFSGNKLKAIPESVAKLENLFMINLNFNCFTKVPSVLNVMNFANIRLDMKTQVKV